MANNTEQFFKYLLIYVYLPLKYLLKSFAIFLFGCLLSSYLHISLYVLDADYCQNMYCKTVFYSVTYNVVSSPFHD